MSPQKSVVRENDIAIIGMACRFPGANDLNAYWQNLRCGVYTVSRFTDEELLAAGIDAETLKEPNYVKANGIIENADMFDAAFFGFSARDAIMMDPQQRVFLETAWEAIENAGYDVSAYQGTVGVYAGAGMNTYLIRNIVPQLSSLEALEQFQLMIASDKDYIATRLSFKLNLTGPSVNVQTSCSTSLVAVHMACQSLLAGESDLALAGGIAIRPSLVSGYAYREGMIYAPDGYCRAFDARAGGTVNGNGVGVILLKKLTQAIADGDNIHAVLKGTAINNDGASKRSYSAPSSEGQAGAIAKAIERAGISAEDISYVEAHGTGTIMGDPIEIGGLTQAFRLTTSKNGYCAIGSVKTNIGHTDAAAGMAGLIKTVQMLKHREIAPSLFFETSNPNIDFPKTPFFVNTALREWDTSRLPLTAGVSSFGVGGTNAHVIVTEAPQIEPSSMSRPYQLLALSARTESALQNAINNLETHLKDGFTGKVADASYTLQTGRKQFEHRAVAVYLDDKQGFSGGADWVHGKTAPDNSPLVFLFSGQGSQYVNMGRGLYEAESVFRQHVDTCAEFLQPILGLDLRNLFYPEAGQEEAAAQHLMQTSITQPALFVIEYALSQLWMSWGIQPQAMIGHSIGEYVAACLAGVLSVNDALTVVAERGRLMHQQPRGAMLAITQSEDEAKALLEQSPLKLEISVINGVNACVISGNSEDIDALEADLTHRQIATRRLQTSHAFHSFMMDEAVEPFVNLLKTLTLNKPNIPYLSNVSGTWITDAEATDPTYYGKHLRGTVRFAQNVEELFKSHQATLLEVGPGQVLATLARRSPSASGAPVFASTRHVNDQRPDQAFVLNTLGQLWMAGVKVDWKAFYQAERRLRIPLPTYPFERQRYWMEEQAFSKVAPVMTKASHSLPASNGATNGNGNHAPAAHDPQDTILKIWREMLGIPTITVQDNFFDLGGNSLVAASLLAQIHKETGIRIPLVKFFQAPNAASVLKMLQSEGWQPQQREKSSHETVAVVTSPSTTHLSMIQIIEGNPSRRPFFWSSGTDFANFARVMDKEQPFFCMPPPGLDGKHPMYSRPEDIVNYHISQMKLVQPFGPYIVGGYCLGGHLALNIATELLRRGEEMALLVLVDVLAPNYEKLAKTTRRNYLERTFYHLRHGQFTSRVVGKLQEVAYRRKINLPGNEELKLLQQLDDIQQVAFEFRIPKGYPGTVVSFTCSVYDARKPADSAERWAQLAPNGVDHYVIPGDHATMMREPNIDQLLAILNNRLYEASTTVAPTPMLA